jgi:hypothetical protein
MREFVIKEDDEFKLKIRSSKCQVPDDYNTLEFIRETKIHNGELGEESTYQFFLTDSEMNALTQHFIGLKS